MSRAKTNQQILHLDAFSGAAGNMFLGALLDLGLSRKALLEGLAPLGLDFKLVVQKVQRGAFAARYVDVRLPKAKSKKSRGHHPHHSHPHTHDVVAHAHGKQFSEIAKMLTKAKLAPSVRASALSTFEALARAEAKVHGTTVDEVHFHEVGAVDAIVDITGAAVAIETLGIDRITCSPVAIGHGTIHSDHGLLPLPAPATLELLAGIPTVPADVEWETLTPTGAAILQTLVDGFGPMPAMIVEKVGYGAGNDRKGELPNVLRAVLGRGGASIGDRVVCIETNLDDFVPEHFDYLMERLFEEGALDVSLQHLQMKKNRAGFLLRVLAKPTDRDLLARLVLGESSAIGVRMSEWDRVVLERRSLKLKTDYGTVRVKVVSGIDGEVSYSPEYDDCKKAAKSSGDPLREVVRRITEQAVEHERS